MSKVRQSSSKNQIRKNNEPGKWGGYSRKTEYLQRQVFVDGGGKQSSLSYRKATPFKDLPSSNSLSLIHSSDSRFAIRSQPNQLNIDRSIYFKGQQTDQWQIVKNKETDKEMSALKLMGPLCKLDTVMYIKKFAFIRIKSNLLDYKQSCTYQDKVQKRQLDLINKLIGKDNEDQSERKLKIPYYNKLVGLCNPLLIKKQILINNGGNGSEMKKEKESIYLNQTPKSQRSEKSFIFNFQITPKPPVNTQKRIIKSSYSGSTKSRSKLS